RYPVTNQADSSTPKKKVRNPHPNPFEIHPGPIRGLHNIRNIHEVSREYKTPTQVTYLWKEVADYPAPAGPDKTIEAILQCITFDWDVEIDNVVEGANGSMVPSKGVTGYVQLSPPAAPIDKFAFKRLLGYEKNTIGGPINCTIRIAGTEQRMRLDRF